MHQIQKKAITANGIKSITKEADDKCTAGNPYAAARSIRYNGENDW